MQRAAIIVQFLHGAEIIAQLFSPLGKLDKGLYYFADVFSLFLKKYFLMVDCLTQFRSCTVGVENFSGVTSCMFSKGRGY